MTKDLSNCPGCVYENAYKDPWPWHTCGESDTTERVNKEFEAVVERCSLCFKEPPCGCGSDKMERTYEVKKCLLQTPEPTQKLGWEEGLEQLVFYDYDDIEWELLKDFIRKVEKEARANVAQECYNQCLAVGCGETEYSEAIRTKFPDLVTKYEI